MDAIRRAGLQQFLTGGRPPAVNLTHISTTSVKTNPDKSTSTRVTFSLRLEVALGRGLDAPGQFHDSGREQSYS
jgi:hypothetical protein